MLRIQLCLWNFGCDPLKLVMVDIPHTTLKENKSFMENFRVIFQEIITFNKTGSF